MSQTSEKNAAACSAGLTVIVPTCNRRKHLARCLEALVNQTLPIARVVVFNDGERDVAAMLERHGEALNIVSLRGGRIGATRARNRALEVVETDLVGFLDDDSLPDADWCKACVAVFRNHAAVTAQLGRLLWARPEHSGMWASTVPQFRQKIYDWRHRLFLDAGFADAVRKRTGSAWPSELPGLALHLSGGNSAIRMSFVKEHGPFSEEFPTLSDREMAYRILTEGGCIAYNPGMTVHHAHDSSLWRSLRRCYHAVPYERRLAARYPEMAWVNALTDSREDSAYRLPDPPQFNRRERACALAHRWARRLGRWFSTTPSANPLAGGHTS